MLLFCLHNKDIFFKKENVALEKSHKMCMPFNFQSQNMQNKKHSKLNGFTVYNEHLGYFTFTFVFAYIRFQKTN